MSFVTMSFSLQFYNDRVLVEGDKNKPEEKYIRGFSKSMLTVDGGKSD